MMISYRRQLIIGLCVVIALFITSCGNYQSHYDESQSTNADDAAIDSVITEDAEIYPMTPGKIPEGTEFAITIEWLKEWGLNICEIDSTADLDWLSSAIIQNNAVETTIYTLGNGEYLIYVSTLSIENNDVYSNYVFQNDSILEDLYQAKSIVEIKDRSTMVIISKDHMNQIKNALAYGSADYWP